MLSPDTCSKQDSGCGRSLGIRKRRAGALAERGIELAQGDLENRDSIQRAVEGAYGVFSMQNFFQAGSGGQVSFPGVTASLMVNSIISKRIAALPTGGCCGGIEKIYPDTEDY